jgi:hypothetical protein
VIHRPGLPPGLQRRVLDARLTCGVIWFDGRPDPAFREEVMLAVACWISLRNCACYR